jgi:hypothetical protein
MGEQQEGGPKHRGANGEMIFKVPGARPKEGLGLAVLIETRFAKTGVRVFVIELKIETVLDQRSAGEGVVADAVSANPGIHKQEREQKKENQPALQRKPAKGERLQTTISDALEHPLP